MTLDHFLALLTFCAVTSITPGPNNIMLMASGINHGVRRTIPHALGILLGWPVMVLLVGLGLGKVFVVVPHAYTALKLAGAAYMLWLAWKISTSAPESADPTARGQPMSFMAAALFQWVNGKAWFMAVSSIATFTLATDYAWSVVAIVSAFFVCGIFSGTGWVLFGAALRRFLTDPRYHRAVNVTLALALVVSLWPMLAH